jgi:hypothetical protein
MREISNETGMIISHNDVSQFDNIFIFWFQRVGPIKRDGYNRSEVLMILCSTSFLHARFFCFSFANSGSTRTL